MQLPPECKFSYKPFLIQKCSADVQSKKKKNQSHTFSIWFFCDLFDCEGAFLLVDV